MFKSGKKNSNDDASLNTTLDKLFDNYMEIDEEKDEHNLMSADGFIQFISDLGILDLEDIRVLVLMWKLGSLKTSKGKPGSITREEFKSGMKNLGKKSIADLIPYLPSLDVGFLENIEFREFYKFVFEFNRAEKEHKFLGIYLYCIIYNIF
jgi:hypothetical protein